MDPLELMAPGDLVRMNCPDGITRYYIVTAIRPSTRDIWVLGDPENPPIGDLV